MRKFNLLLLTFLAFASCTMDDDAISPEVHCIKIDEVYNNENGISINLIQQDWHLRSNALNGVDVGVRITGSIQGDSAVIRSIGDGLISDSKIVLNEKKQFDMDFGIFFTSSPLSEKEITASTTVMVFKGQDTLKVEINSCPLQNLSYQGNQE